MEHLVAMLRQEMTLVLAQVKALEKVLAQGLELAREAQREKAPVPVREPEKELVKVKVLTPARSATRALAREKARARETSLTVRTAARSTPRLARRWPHSRK